MPLVEYDPSLNNWMLLIYGDNGAGKTHLAFTMPGKKRVIDYQANAQVKEKFPGEDIKVAKGPTKWEEIQKMWSDPWLLEADVPILDNLTGLYRTLLEEAIKIPTQGDREKRISPEIPILRDYGLASERLRWCCTNFAGLAAQGKRCIAVCHTRVEKNEDGNIILGYPSVPGQIPAFVLSLFPEVIYLRQSDDGKRTAYLQRFGLWSAQTRILSETIIKDPNLKNMYCK